MCCWKYWASVVESDSRVRSAAAFALERITEQDFIAGQYEIEITPSFMANSIFADEPEGSITGKAREWWNKRGSKVKWHSSYGLCALFFTEKTAQHQLQATAAPPLRGITGQSGG